MDREAFSEKLTPGLSLQPPASSPGKGGGPGCMKGGSLKKSLAMSRSGTDLSECYTRTSLRTGGEFGSERGRLELKQAGAKTKGLACHIKRCGLLTSKEGGQREALARILGSHSHQL